MRRFPHGTGYGPVARNLKRPVRGAGFGCTNALVLVPRTFMAMHRGG